MTDLARAWLRQRGNQVRRVCIVEQITGRRIALSTVSRWATGARRPDACTEALILTIANFEGNQEPT